MDCDGVFTDFVKGVLNVVWQITGQKLTADEFPEWELIDQLVARFPKYPNLKKDIWDRLESQGFCASLEPLPGAEDALRQLVMLNNSGHIHLHIVTAPWEHGPYWMHERAQWLKGYGVTKKMLHHTHSKHIVRGDLFVDDKVENVVRWSHHNNPYGAFIWDTAHNRTEGDPCRRLKGWDEFFEVLRARLP